MERKTEEIPLATDEKWNDVVRIDPESARFPRDRVGAVGRGDSRRVLRGEGMIHERVEKLLDGSILRCREIQTELAEWVEVGPRGLGEKDERLGVRCGAVALPALAAVRDR